MQIFVKVLGSQERSIQVEPSETISGVKKKIEQELDIPYEMQRLLFKGSPLHDSSSLSDHEICENSKLHVSVRKAMARNPPQHTDALWIELRKFLKRHFSERDAEAVLKNFKEDFRATLDKLSLDDLERIGEYYLQQRSSSKT